MTLSKKLQKLTEYLEITGTKVLNLIFRWHSRFLCPAIAFIMQQQPSSSSPLLPFLVRLITVITARENFFSGLMAVHSSCEERFLRLEMTSRQTALPKARQVPSGLKIRRLMQQPIIIIKRQQKSVRFLLLLLQTMQSSPSTSFAEVRSLMRASTDQTDAHPSLSNLRRRGRVRELVGQNVSQYRSISHSKFCSWVVSQ